MTETRDYYGGDTRENSPLIEFIGVYSDDTKISRTYDSSYFWYVKKETM